MLPSSSNKHEQQENALSAYQLQAIPSEFDQQVWSHSLEFVGRGKWLSQIEFNQTELALVALSATGIPLAQLQWSKSKGLNMVQAPIIEFDSKQVLRDIQLIHWPIASIEAGFNDSTYSVSEDKAKSHRIIKQGQQRLITINYQKDKITFDNALQQYQLIVTPF